MNEKKFEHKLRIAMGAKVNMSSIAYDKSKRNATIASVTLENILAIRENKCERCGRESMLSLDHIVPVNILKMMGLSVMEIYGDEQNLALLCRPCNSLKSGNLDFSDKRTKPLLLKYLERL